MKSMKPDIHSCTCSECQRHPRSATADEHRAINRLVATLDEKHRRQLVGLLAWQWGWGSIALLHEITGLSCPTIQRGRDEIQKNESPEAVGRVRRPGAGQPAVEKNSRPF
jgi:hypothetical protein